MNQRYGNLNKQSFIAVKRTESATPQEQRRKDLFYILLTDKYLVNLKPKSKVLFFVMSSNNSEITLFI